MKPTENKDESNSYCYCVMKGLPLPILAKLWMMLDEDGYTEFALKLEVVTFAMVTISDNITPYSYVLFLASQLIYYFHSEANFDLLPFC